MTQKKGQAGRKEKDVLKNLGDFIEGHFKKGISKVEEIFKDNEAADDKLFSYLKIFLDDKGVAAVTPSSKYLIERVVKAMDLRNAKTVVEYGAAAGIMTWPILSRLPPDGKLLAIELNDRLFEALSRRSDPRLRLYHGDVRRIDSIAGQFGFSEVDVVVSGIPFAFLSSGGRRDLLAKTAALLKPGGRFVVYQHTTHLIPLFNDYFKGFKTQFELRNLPPYFVFTAVK